MKHILILSIVTIISFSSCLKMETQAEKDEAKIQEYLEENNINAQKTQSGLYYVINVEGSGITPSWNSYITINYKGYLLDGTVFDSTSTNSPVRMYLQSTIAGWQEGIPKFKPGGEGTLFIPSRLGYGSTAKTKIPANSVLIFDIELIAVN